MSDFPDHWQLLPLEDVMEAIIDYRGKTPKKTDEGIPLITAKIVKGGRILEPSEFIAESDYDSWMVRGLPEVGDVVVTSEAPLGEVAQLTESNVALAQRIVTLRGKKGILNNDFLLCAMQSNYVQHQLESRASGSTVKGIKQSELRKVLLPIPPEVEQIEIATHIKTLSNKIELNRQTNHTLEQIAQVLFKSWFVDFEPVKAKIKAKQNGQDPELAAMCAISGKTEEQLKGLSEETLKQLQTSATLFPDELVESELGGIPEGWIYSEIGNEVTVVGGGTPSTKNPVFWEGGHIHWTSPRDMSKLTDKILLDTDRKITEAGLAKISSGLLPKNTILMSSRAPVGYLAIAKVPVAINQGYIAMKCETKLSPEYVVQWTESIMDEIKKRASGTTFAEISKKNFKIIPVIVPHSDVISEYSKTVSNIYSKITEEMRETKYLMEIRDTLLPKLLSGEMELAG